MAFRDTTRPSGKAPVSPVKLGKGMLDMFAGATRGAVRASVGLLGDIETLGRMGYAWATDTETTKNKLPNTEDFDEILPPATLLSADRNLNSTVKEQKNPFDELGGYVGGIPVYGATAKAGVKIGKNFNKLLQPSGPTAPSSMSRREFMKKGGAVAATAAIGGVAGKVLSKLDQPAIEAVKAAEKVPAAARKYKFNNLQEYAEDIKSREMWDTFGDVAKMDEDTYQSVKRIKDLQDSGVKLTAKQQEYLDEMGGVLDEFSPQAKKEMSDIKLEAHDAREAYESRYPGRYETDWTDLLQQRSQGGLGPEAAVGAGLGGITAGQKIFRGSFKDKELVKEVSRRFANPGNELGAHVTVDPKTADIFTADFMREDPTRVGVVYEMKSKVNKPLTVVDTQGDWTPYYSIDKIKESKDPFSAEGIKKLDDIEDRYRADIDKFFDRSNDLRKKYANLSEYTKEINSKYSKEIQQVVKSEGYDHISYINTVEGTPSESAILFDEDSFELLGVKQTKP